MNDPVFKPKGFLLDTDGLLMAYESSEYWVRIHNVPKSRFGYVKHLLITRKDLQPVHCWKDLQHIKNTFGGEDKDAIEIYPKESHLVDTSNTYHLWILMDQDINIGYNKRYIGQPTTNHKDVYAPNNFD